ncbi:unnamed protein product [Schistocephalus solidus]|uniref:Chromatin complexes subunit BAP18 n=1 Tax=Schistocephalus solidus TaxID=70667 RepID=A0A183SIW8_SCHSO|nr:unnamed protein product [Schistocephalus solidus]
MQAGLLTRNRTLGIGGWNLRTFLDLGSQSVTARSLYQYNVDMCCLSEVRIPDSGSLEIKTPGAYSHFTLYRSGPRDFSEYTGEILTEARALANYSGRSKITESDVKLAVDSKTEQLILTPLHREQLLEYAEKVNSQPLPPIKPGHGIRLGPEKYTLTAPNFTITSSLPSSVDNSFTQSSAALTGQVASRITMPGAGSGVTVFRVASAAPGHLPNLVPAAEADISTTVGGTSGGLHVIAPIAAPASLIRVQSGNSSGTVGSPVLPLSKPNTGAAQHVSCLWVVKDISGHPEFDVEYHAVEVSFGVL